MARWRGSERVAETRTRKLTGAAYGLAVSRRRPLMWLFVSGAVLLLAGGALGVGWQQYQGSLGAGTAEALLKQENATLSQALQQAELQARHEATMRETLEKQLAEQSEELKRLRGELAFFQRNKK